MTKSTISELQKKSFAVRKSVIGMIVKAHASHIGSAYSCVDIIVYLYYKFLKIDPKKTDDSNRDRFILSKGWAVSAQYAILAERGFFEKKILDDYCTDGSKLIGGSTKNGLPGIEATTTSMGHGLPVGLGMAMAGKLQNKNYRVVVLISDGECDEGSVWESVLIAAHHNLNNLIVIIDANKWQAFGRVKEVLNIDPIGEKFKSFNWHVQEIDGHDFEQLDEVFHSKSLSKVKPNVIIANTIKGKGLPSIEDDLKWHYQTPREDEQAEAKEKGLL